MKIDTVVVVVLRGQVHWKRTGVAGELEAALEVVFPMIPEDSMPAFCSRWLEMAVEYLLTQVLEGFVEDGATTNGTGARHDLFQFETISVRNLVADAVPRSTAQVANQNGVTHIRGFDYLFGVGMCGGFRLAEKLKGGHAGRTADIDEGLVRSQLHSLHGGVAPDGRDSEDNAYGHKGDGDSHRLVYLTFGWHLVFIDGMLPQFGKVVGNDIGGCFFVPRALDFLVAERDEQGMLTLDLL